MLNVEMRWETGHEGGVPWLQIRLHPTPVSHKEPSNFVEVLDTMTNLGPILDFVVVDLERQGQGQVPFPCQHVPPVYCPCKSVSMIECSGTWPPLHQSSWVSSDFQRHCLDFVGSMRRRG
jgi:hypothetical protein